MRHSTSRWVDLSNNYAALLIQPSLSLWSALYICTKQIIIGTNKKKRKLECIDSPGLFLFFQLENLISAKAMYVAQRLIPIAAVCFISSCNLSSFCFSFRTVKRDWVCSALPNIAYSLPRYQVLVSECWEWCTPNPRSGFQDGQFCPSWVLLMMLLHRNVNGIETYPHMEKCISQNLFVVFIHPFHKEKTTFLPVSNHEANIVHCHMLMILLGNSGQQNLCTWRRDPLL